MTIFTISNLTLGATINTGNYSNIKPEVTISLNEPLMFDTELDPEQQEDTLREYWEIRDYVQRNLLTAFSEEKEEPYRNLGELKREIDQLQRERDNITRLFKAKLIEINRTLADNIDSNSLTVEALEPTTFVENLVVDDPLF